MRYELVIVWQTGEIERYYYADMETAMLTENGFKTAFGSQIQWTVVNKK